MHTLLAPPPTPRPARGPDLFQISLTGPLSFSSPYPYLAVGYTIPVARGANTAALSFGVREKQGRQEPTGSPTQPFWAGGQPRTRTSEARLSEDVFEPNWQSLLERKLQTPLASQLWAPPLRKWFIVV